LRDASKVISVHEDELPSSVERFFGEWKVRGKELEKAQEGISEGFAYRLIAEAKAKKEKLVRVQVDFDSRLVEKIALQISAEPGFSAIVWNKAGFITVACNAASGKNAIELLKAEKAVGGGSKEFARGKKK
jgi:alanyl-tRNA synthetase